jgi:hypothetical protein
MDQDKILSIATITTFVTMVALAAGRHYRSRRGVAS